MRKAIAISCTLSLATVLPSLRAQEVSLPQGTALRIELDQRLRIRRGAKVTGHLTQPVYLVDHQVIPTGSIVQGTIRGIRPGPRAEHIQRLLAADFTPPRIPEVVFETLLLPDGQAAGINAPASVTTASVLTLGTQRKKQTIKAQIGDAIGQGRQNVEDTLHHHHFTETVEKWAVGQLPYHPDILWSGTRFNADLLTPVLVPDPVHTTLPVEDLGGHLPQGVLHARLSSPVSSKDAKRGDPVEAIVTQPLLTPDGSKVLVPEGTRLQGVIVRAKAARSFGRNGDARFAFRKLDLPENAGGSVLTGTATPIEIHGRLSAAETSPDQHIQLDEEGQAKAADGPAKYAEPLLLAALAAAAGPDDHDASPNSSIGASTVASNGFGLIARVVSLSTRNYSVVQGFAFYALAKSVYYRFIAKGHETSFARDTEIQVTLSER